MIAYPEIINAPNQTVLLDLSKIDTANYAQSEILVVVQSSDQNTILVLPSASQIFGSPTIYIQSATIEVQKSLTVNAQAGDFLQGYPKGMTELPSLVKIKKVLVGGDVGVWYVEATSKPDETSKPI